MYRRRALPVWAVGAVLCSCFWASPAWAQDYEIDAPPLALAGIPFDVLVAGEAAGPEVLEVRAGGQTLAAEVHEDGGFIVAGIVIPSSGAAEIELLVNGSVVADASVRVIPGWISIMLRCPLKVGSE